MLLGGKGVKYRKLLKRTILLMKRAMKNPTSSSVYPECSFNPSASQGEGPVDFKFFRSATQQLTQYGKSLKICTSSQAPQQFFPKQCVTLRGSYGKGKASWVEVSFFVPLVFYCAGPQKTPLRRSKFAFRLRETSGGFFFLRLAVAPWRFCSSGSDSS